VYNSHGVSNGMAVVTFQVSICNSDRVVRMQSLMNKQRHGDAGKARDKYNGKIVDGSMYMSMHSRAKSVTKTESRQGTPSRSK
jgi:hypothetical protein